MPSTRPAALAAVLALLVAVPAARPDVLVLKDGKTLEGDVADKGNAYEIKTRYGTLTVDKADVKKVLKDPGQMTAEAATCRKLARGMYDDALQTADPKERNRKLTAGVELLERALKGYNDAREVFTGPEYEYLDKEAATTIQEMRLYRDKMVTEQAVKPPEPPKPPEPAPAAVDDPGASLLAPVRPPSTPPVPAAVTPAPEKPVEPAKPKTPEELIADLGAPEAALRLSAAEQLGKSPVETALVPLAERLKSESDAGVCAALGAALGGYDGAALAKQAALKEAAKGSDPQKRAVIAAVKKAGTEPACRLLVDAFVAQGEMPLRNEVASALKKHKALAVKPLLDLLRKSQNKPDILADCVKYLGIIGESRTAPQVVVRLLEPDELRNLALHALRKIDKPVIPALIQYGLPGSTHCRQWSGWLLRYFTGMTTTSQNAAEWAAWWKANMRSVEAEERKWDKADADCDWLVDNRDWSEYDLDIVGNVRMLAWFPGRMSVYQSSRGRPRGQGGGELDLIFGGRRPDGWGPGAGRGGRGEE